MNIKGKVTVIGETQTFGNNNFRKREFVITTDEQYPQPIMVEFVQDKCDILNNYKVGDVVDVGINLRGREWVNQQGETKYFNSIQGWKIEKVGGSVTSSNDTPFPTIPEDEVKKEIDDLPF